MNNKPIFTTAEIIPYEFNLPTKMLRNQNETDFRGYVEKLRQHFISLHKGGHPVFATNKTIADLTDSFKRYLSKFNYNDTLKLTGSKSQVIPLFGKPTPIEKKLDHLLFYKTKYTNGINHWFPEIWDTKVSNGKAITDQFYDQETFYKNVRDVVIKDRFKFHKNSNGEARIGDFLIQCLRIVNGNQPVYNFPSTLARWIYYTKAQEVLKTRDDFWILDTSMGWGGRMLGALGLEYIYRSSGDPINMNKRFHYYGTDVNIGVHDRFDMFLDYWKNEVYLDSQLSFYKSTEPAENLFNDNKFNDYLDTFDIMFTSPPYFNKEMYSNDVNQSYLTYDNNYEAWRDGFLRGMLSNTYKLLNKGGEAWINIADVKYKGSTYHPLEADTIKMAEEAGFEYIDKYYMVFGIMVGLDKRSTKSKLINEQVYGKKETKNKNTKGANPQTKNTFVYADKKYKFEPIFVFKK